LGLTRQRGGGESVVVPVVAEPVAVEPEPIAGYGGVDHSPSRGGVDVEDLAATPALYLVPLAAAHEVVVIGIQRGQYPELPVGVSVENEEIAVVLGQHLDLGMVAPEEPAVVVDPEPDRGLVARGTPNAGRGVGEE